MELERETRGRDRVRMEAEPKAAIIHSQKTNKGRPATSAGVRPLGEDKECGFRVIRCAGL